MAAKPTRGHSNGGVVSVATQLQVIYCFDAIVDTLHTESGERQAPLAHTWTGDKFPLFVTWKKRHGSAGEWKLRGCIGTFAAKELSAGLREYAVIAAFHDSRFAPIVSSELSQLRCDISLLTHFEPLGAGNIYDWRIGVHGIQIDLTEAGRHYSATFLPEVAREQGWTHEETIEELVHKSGYRGTLTAELKQRIQLTRYQSEKESLTYDRYCALRSSIVDGTHTSAAVSPAEVKHKRTQAEHDGEEEDASPPRVQKKRSKLSTSNGDGVHSK